ncbi:MAG: Lrp/AsnC family transcriptional regulator [archaeon]
MVTYNRDLIYLRSENARMSLRETANLLRKSPQRLKYSINVLEKDGILRHPYCVFDYSFFGLILFRVYFKGGYISEREKSGILDKLQANPYVVSVYELSGEFDLTVEFASPNPSKFNKELKKLSMLSKTLSDYKIILNLVTHIPPRDYLTARDELHRLHTERIVGGDREKEGFTANEMTVMKNLLNHPLARMTGLAKMSGLNVKTTKSMIASLTRRNIIRGFKYSLDKNRLGIYKFRLFLRLHNLASEREAGLMAHLLKTREVTRINKTVGDWDMEVDIESFEKTGIRYLIMHLREQFLDIIEKFNLIEFTDTYKRVYLPSFIFEDGHG